MRGFFSIKLPLFGFDRRLVGMLTTFGLLHVPSAALLFFKPSLPKKNKFTHRFRRRGSLFTFTSFVFILLESSVKIIIVCFILFKNSIVDLLSLRRLYCPYEDKTEIYVYPLEDPYSDFVPHLFHVFRYKMIKIAIIVH